MPPLKLDGRHFSPDIRAFFRHLCTHEVRYLVVGGEAVIFYGHARLTGDVDFFFSSDPENRTHLFQALDGFWDGQVPGLDGPEDLALSGVIVQFGVAPNRIDLINEIEGVEFEEAWSERQEVTLSLEADELPIYYIGLEHLIRNKEATGRPKDLDDLAYLREARQP